MAVREAEGDSQRTVHVELEVESGRGVTAHAERPLLFRCVVHERAVHHDFRGGRHVVARVDGLRAVRLDVGVLGRRRQNHHTGDSHRRNAHHLLHIVLLLNVNNSSTAGSISHFSRFVRDFPEHGCPGSASLSPLCTYGEPPSWRREGRATARQWEAAAARSSIRSP